MRRANERARVYPRIGTGMHGSFFFTEGIRAKQD